MKANLERKLYLSTEPEKSSLYEWSLQEINDDQEPIGGDKIPWPWALWFTAGSLKYNMEISGNDNGDAFEYSDDSISNNTDYNERESISGSLFSGSNRNGSWSDKVRFTMFGASRPINSFDLLIIESEDDEEPPGKKAAHRKDSCFTSGFVEYSSENDFLEETEPDYVQVVVKLKSKPFKNLAGLIARSEIESLELRLERVCGFYSDWSPSVTTNSIKILAGRGDHKIFAKKGCEIQPPRLGKVGEYSLNILTSVELFSNGGPHAD